MKPRLILITGVFASIAYGVVAVSLHILPLPILTAFSIDRPVVEAPRVFTIGWVGDMVPADDAYNQQALLGVQYLTQKPDLMIGNLEGTFASDGRVSKCIHLTSRCHAFAGDPNFADALVAAGFDMVNLANNHAYDFGEAGLKETQVELDRVGLPYVAITTATKNLVINGSRVGVLGLSGTRPWNTVIDYDFITREVTKLRATNDVVVVLFHAGAEGADKTVVTGETEYVGTENRGNVQLLAYTAIDAGADLVLGSGPHVLRKVEWYKDRLIAYSLGNFVGGKRLTTRGILGTSAMISVSFDAEHKPISYTLDSVALSANGMPYPDMSDAGRLLIEKLSQ